jgi:hypothetical protein
MSSVRTRSLLASAALPVLAIALFVPAQDEVNDLIAVPR